MEEESKKVLTDKPSYHIQENLEPGKESNHISNLFSLAIDYCYENSLLTFEQVDKVVSNFCDMFSTESVLKIYLKIFEKRAASAYELRKETSISKKTVYRAIRRLEDEGLIVKARPVKTGKHRPYTIYSIPDYRPEDIKNAFERDKRLRTPHYKEVQRLYQLILNDYIEPKKEKIPSKDIDLIIKKECKGVLWYDLKEAVHRKINNAGYTIVYQG